MPANRAHKFFLGKVFGNSISHERRGSRGHVVAFAKRSSDPAQIVADK